MDVLLRDVRYAVRSLGRAPGFTAIAVLTLAIGIGASTSIFSVVDAVVLQPLPFHDPERVVAIGEQFQPGNLSAVSAGNFEDWRREARSFSEIGARRFASFNVSGEQTPERLLGGAVTHGYFSVFGVSPALGRLFTPEEDQPGRDAVVILSHRLWSRMFAGNANVVGRVIRLDGRPHTIIGVMSAAFDRLDQAEEFWVPAAFAPAVIESHDGHSMTAVGRLAPGVSVEEARAELAIIFARMKMQLPGNTEVRQGVVEPYTSQVIGNARQRVLVLFAAVGLVLLIACGNVAHLLLARGRLRGTEMALRAALGASSSRLVRQLMTEALVLAATGGALGVALAYAAVPLLTAMSPADVARLDQARVNADVLLFALGAIAISALATGALPALGAVTGNLRGSLNESSRTATRGHEGLRGMLVTAEVALAIVLLTGAGLLVRSAIHLQAVDRGFDETGVLTAQVSFPALGYETPERMEVAFQALVDRLEQVPGVEAAAVSSSVPMAPGANNNGLVPEGKTFDPNDFVLGRMGVIGGDYFGAFRIPVITGRTFTAQDRRGSPPVMILSATAARQLFPGENAVGRRVACCELGPEGAPLERTVIGIVGDVRADGPREDPRPDFYMPVAQAPPDAWRWIQRTMTAVVRGSATNAADLAPFIRGAVREIDPTVPVHNVATMQQRLATTLAQDRFNTVLMLLLGAIGLLLATIGIYGVVTCFVAHRRRELAIRVALGAQGRSVVMMVLHQGMRPVWAGVALGILSGGTATRALAGELFGVGPHDPLTFAAVVGVLVAAAAVANGVPAWAAARVDPAKLLNQ
ncbi:MAG: ABC transporter permease [Vicinamibacterales bacterium]